MVNTTNLKFELNCDAWDVYEEQMLLSKRKDKRLVIAMPNETSRDENRVCLTPESVLMLNNQGHEIIVQRGAGLGANFSNTAYSDNGAQIVESLDEIYAADIVLKPTTVTAADASRMRERQVILSPIQYYALKKDAVTEMMRKKVTAIAFNFLQDEDGYFPVEAINNEMAGNVAIMVANEYLSRAHGGRGVLLGSVSGITPTEVVIFGADTLGEYAARAAIGLGAQVKIFDHSISRLRYLRTQLGSSLYTSVFHQQVLEKALTSADVVIGSVSCYDADGSYMITEEQVKLMKEGSVIVDLSVEHGGCIETSVPTSHVKPTFDYLGVLHYCVPNMLSRVAKTASIANSNVLSSILETVGKMGGFKNALQQQQGLRSGVYIYEGTLIKRVIAEKFGLIWRDFSSLLGILSKN